MTGTAPQSITCVDCGDDAHLLSVSEPDERGERIATYRCAGCLDRWDVIVADDEPAPSGHGAGPEAPLTEGEAGPVSS